MFEVTPSKEITGRVIRNAPPKPSEDEWIDSSPEERIEAVWILTKLCFAWDQHRAGEPRLQRTVTHTQRSRR